MSHRITSARGNHIGSLAELISLLWEQITRQRDNGHEHLFTAWTGSPIDMNVHRRRKMRALLSSLGIPQAGFHAFRHFNVSLLDAQRVPLKTIQERAGHAPHWCIHTGRVRRTT